MFRNKVILLTIFLILLAACSNQSGGRIHLTIEDLTIGFESNSPLAEEILMRPGDASEPKHVFNGRLELIGEGYIGEIELLRGSTGIEPYLPEFDFEFVQVADFLVPLNRGLIHTGHDQWNYFLEPGRVWYEQMDGEFSRASFPFALAWVGSNAIHNGTMMFLFNDTEVSKVWYQVTQETAISIRADMWGLLDAKYHPEEVENAQELRTAFVNELSEVVPTKPIEDLASDYKGVDISAFGDGVSPEAMTWYGFVKDGVNYLGGCQTRYGKYPYCEYMRAPSYSTAKSAFVSVALMRLEQKYGDGVSQLKIKDFVPESAYSIGNWSNVTFDHVLDMATGNYETSARMVDEEHWDTDPFWNEEYYEPRIKAAFSWPHSAAPGTTWVYRTFDTFIVTRAMHNFLKSQEGEDADIFDFVVEEVYKPLDMGPGVFSTLRTKDDNWHGQPVGGYGLWWIPDDLAKITTFMNKDSGMIGGVQILHPDLLDDALQRDPADRGVRRDGNGRYNNAFWADSYDLGCAVWVPHWYGYSGIVVALMPNGTAYYYASDNREFDTSAAIQESNNLKPMCQE